MRIRRRVGEARANSGRWGERGGGIADGVLIVAAVGLLGIGGMHLIGDLMHDELEQNSDRRVLAFYDFNCPEDWVLVKDSGQRYGGRRVDTNDDGLVCEKSNRLRPNSFIDNIVSTDEAVSTDNVDP
ncbi:MAG: hypothetical protein KJN63_09865 [Acidimicrobiia bacterium]|nr:hypothetical protein [Acidimicrobiia bacterium]